MTNSNVLEGMACPECKSEGPFHIEVTTLVKVYDSGIDDHGDTEWTDTSYCQCDECGHDGKVKDFTVEE